MEDKKVITAASEVLFGPRVPLFGSTLSKTESALSTIQKVAPVPVIKSIDGAGKESGQGSPSGILPHPISVHNALKLKDTNVHHSTCIEAKVATAVGMGFVTELDREKRKAQQQMQMQMQQMSQNPPKPESNEDISKEDVLSPDWQESRADEILDPLCVWSFQDVLTTATAEFFQTGCGYIEVVRKGAGGEIVAMHHLKAEQTFVCVEQDQYHFHYVIMGDNGSSKRFAAFGDSARLQAAIGKKQNELASFNGFRNEPQSTETVSEVIQFRMPTSKSRWYGYPDWLSATAGIDLVKCLLQYKYDFFNNRGVPEYLLFVMGRKVGKKAWKDILDSMKAHIGLGNSHKSLAVNLPDPETKIHVEKLGLDGSADDALKEFKTDMSFDIVSAHRVPPLLAGILVPGKIGAANELPNALVAFQSLVISQAQRIIQRALINTLANPKLNGGLELKKEDCELRTILDRFDLNKMDTMSRMREPVAGSERNLDEGLKD